MIYGTQNCVCACAFNFNYSLYRVCLAKVFRAKWCTSEDRHRLIYVRTLSRPSASARLVSPSFPKQCPNFNKSTRLFQMKITSINTYNFTTVQGFSCPFVFIKPEQIRFLVQQSRGYSGLELLRSLCFVLIFSVWLDQATKVNTETRIKRLLF